MTESPLQKLGCLLDEDWLEVDVLNAMAKHLYFCITAEADDVDFIYLPALAFNDARHLCASDQYVYGPTLTAFCHLLSEEPIKTITFNVWHNNHYHTFYYNSTKGFLIRSDSQHGLAPDDVLPIINWLLHSTSYPYLVICMCMGIPVGTGMGSHIWTHQNPIPVEPDHRFTS